MYQDERRLDFHALGREIKRKREAKGWTQEYLAQLVDRTPRSIMYFENRGQHPSLNTFYKIVTLLDISVDQFFYPDKQNEESDCRQHIDRMLNTMDENELTIMEATAEGIQKARETEVKQKGPSFFLFLEYFSGVPLNGKQCKCQDTCEKCLLRAVPPNPEIRSVRSWQRIRWMLIEREQLIAVSALFHVPPHAVRLREFLRRWPARSKAPASPVWLFGNRDMPPFSRIAALRIPPASS